jgi:hypothetical protein
MARFIEFGLGSSTEPGYCLNTTRVQGLWTDTTAEDNDLKFVPNQPGLEVYAEGANPTNYSIAVTSQAVLSASVQVRCLDYGAYGSVWAYAYGLGLARWKGTLVERGAQIPLDQRDGLDNDGDGRVDEDLVDMQDNDGDGRIDEDAQGNCIYDGWQWNNGAATDDDDPEPPNQWYDTDLPVPGDLLSRYEEYRGFIIQGTHSRLNPQVKDVFVYNPDNFDLSVFRTLGLAVHEVRNNEFDFVALQPIDDDGDGRFDEDPFDGINQSINQDGDRWFDEDPIDTDDPDPDLCSFGINRYARTAHIGLQRVVAIRYANMPYIGRFAGSLPGICVALIGVRFIRFLSNPVRAEWSIDHDDSLIIRWVVGHELGNTVSIRDHSTGTQQCVMFDNNDNEFLINIRRPIPQEYCNQHPEICRLRFRLH